MRHEFSRKTILCGKSLLLPALLLCTLAITAHAATRYSNGTGGGSFNDTNTWLGGIVPSQSGDSWVISSGDTVTIPDGYSWSNPGMNNYIDGRLVVQPRGYLSMARLYSSVSNWSIHTEGTVSVSRTAPTYFGTISVAAGLYDQRENTAATIPRYELSGGKLAIGSSVGQTIISNGVYDMKLTSGSFNGGLTWLGGTIANWRIASNTERGKVKNEQKAGCTLDISDQTWSAASCAMDWNNFSFGPTSQLGTIQFDVYSAADNDCDAMTNVSMGSATVNTSVVFVIGCGSGLPGVWTDYTNSSYQLVRANGPYNTITPTVPDARWTWLGDGTSYDVVFDNRINIDGSVKIRRVVIPGFTPCADIIDPPADVTVAPTTTTYRITGTNNAATVGSIAWSNHRGGSGSVPASLAGWSFDVSLSNGLNLITVMGTNTAGYAVGDSVMITRLGTEVDSNGWTVLTPAHDSRIIYVSSSEGNDATAEVYAPTSTVVGTDPFNPAGPVHAFQSASNAQAKVRGGHPDWLLFKCGDVWYENVAAMSGRSPGERAVMAAYGAGTARPLFKTGASAGVRTGSAGWSNGVMLSLQFKAHTRDPWSGEYASSNGSVGLSCVTAAGRPMEHILIEDCSFSFYSLNLSLQSAGPMSDVFVRRCQILDAYSVNSHSQGFYAHNAAVTLEETVFDHNGWLVQGSNNIQAFGGATMFNHNTYFSDCDECIFRDNIFLRSSSIQNKWTSNLLGVDPVTNIVTEGNLYVDGEIGISMGGNDTGDYRWVTITVTSNIFTNIGQSQPTGRTLGWGIDVIDWSNGLVADNLVIRQTNAAVANVYGINTGTQSGRDVLIRDNTLWGLNGGDALKPNGAGITSITWLRNKVQANVAQTRAANANAFPTGHVFRTNIYYSTRAASDWFRLGSQACSFDQWAQQVGEAGSCTGKVAFVDPDRSVERYNALVGGAQSYTDFIARVRQQSKRTWRPEYTAQAINAWIRDGFRNAGAPLFPSVVINDGATQTFSHTVMLSLSAEDPVPVTMQISESPDFGGAAWTAYTTRWAFTLSPAIGGKTVYARFASGGSNITDTASASIVLVPEPVGVIVAVALAIIARRT